jgi:hypothetical protein
LIGRCRSTRPRKSNFFYIIINAYLARGKIIKNNIIAAEAT